MPAQSRFTADRRKVIVDTLKMGASRRTAAAMARIGESTLRRWLEKGENAPQGSQFAQFYEDVAQAEAEPNVRALAVVGNAMLDKPDIAFKWLERREPGFAPPAADKPAAQAPQVIVLTLDDGRPVIPALQSVPNEANTESA